MGILGGIQGGSFPNATQAVMGMPSIDRATGALAGPASQAPAPNMQPGQRMDPSGFLRMMEAYRAGQQPGQPAPQLQQLNEQAVLDPLGNGLSQFLGNFGGRL